MSDLTSPIHRDFAYQPGATTIGTPAAEVLHRRAGLRRLTVRPDRAT